MNANAAKTHCKQGHEYTPENTGRRLNGQRWCRACNNAARMRRFQKNGRPSRSKYAVETTIAVPRGPQFKTHCRNGHELTDANVRLRSDGHKQCRTCEQDNRRRWRALHAAIPSSLTRDRDDPGRPEQPPEVRWMPTCTTCSGFGWKQHGLNNWTRCTAHGCQGGYVWSNR